MEELRSDLETVKKKLRESERENTRMKRAMEKVTTLEAEKKKLEKLILDVSNDRKEQVELLLSASYDLYT